MELRSSNSSPQSREFEFSAAATHHQTTADHLFHKGKLLPLYSLSLPFTAATRLGSSPSESCRASCDLSSDDFFFEWSNDLNAFINHSQNHPQITKPSWPKKLKQSILAHKLRASKAYLKSLFVKSACSAKPNSAAPAPNRKPTIANVMSSDAAEDNNPQRRSFSSAIKRHSPTKCLSSSSSNSSSGSSSFSLNSNGLQELQCLRRSSSATEIEGSIEAAIAHCKKSHQIF